MTVIVVVTATVKLTPQPACTCVQGAVEAAHGERAALLAALSAVRAEMEAAAAAVLAQRAEAGLAAAANLRAARRQVRRLAAENEALMRLSNAQHAELARRLPPAPDQAPPPAPDQAHAAEVAARLGRIEAALVERAEGGAGGGPDADTRKPCPGPAPTSQEACAVERRGADADASAHAGAAACSTPAGLHVAGREARPSVKQRVRIPRQRTTIRNWNVADAE